MSWIYTLVFTGLLFSSGDATNTGEGSPVQVTSAEVSIQAAETEKFDQTYPLSANGFVNISNINGSITIEVWDRNEVRLVATKTADSAEALQRVKLDIDATTEKFSVAADHGMNRIVLNKNRSADVRVDMKLWVPRTVSLDAVEAVNGTVTVAGVKGPVVRLTVVNGTINAEGISGNAELSTVNGEVRADVDRIEKGARLNFSTVNGKVNVLIPSDTDATIKADSLNGSITTDLGLTVKKGEFIGRDMNGRLGSGAGRIKLDSVNGEIFIGRKNDGRKPSAVTDLVGSSSEFPAVTLRGSDRAMHGAMVAQQRAAAAAQRETARAMASAQKELAKVNAKTLNKSTLAELQNLKIDINSDKIEKSIREGMRAQTIALANIASFDMPGPLAVAGQTGATFPIKARAKVTIEGGESSVRVSGWDRGEVKYILTQYEAVDEGEKPIKVVEEVSGDNIRLILPRASEFPARLEVFVPRNADVTVKTEGDIRISNVKGAVAVNGGDMSIDLRDVGGSLDMTAGDARIRLIGFDGELRSQSGDGDVYLDGKFSSLDLAVGDGMTYLTLPDDVNAQIIADRETLAVEGLKEPTKVAEGQWRFGAGTAKYQLKLGEGSLLIRSAQLLAVAN